MSPSAKKFFERSASREVTPSMPLSASTVIDDSATGWTWKSPSDPSSSGFDVVARLLEVALVEGVGVGDERPALREVADVDLERGRVHRDEDARLVAGREDVVVGEVDLEAGHAGKRAGRRADLRREVGERREVVAEDGRLAREAIARELHAVTRVAGEPDHDPFEMLDGLGCAHGRGIADAAALPRAERAAQLSR